VAETLTTTPRRQGKSLFFFNHHNNKNNNNNIIINTNNANFFRYTTPFYVMLACKNSKHFTPWPGFEPTILALKCREDDPCTSPPGLLEGVFCFIQF
jgi:hypothetical protein